MHESRVNWFRSKRMGMPTTKARKPPSRWRGNMVTAVLLLAVLDYIIVSPSPNPTRIVFALIVTLAVLGFVAETWRRNKKLERETGAR